MSHLKKFAKHCANSLLSVYAWVRIKLNRSPTLLILTYHRVLPVGHSDRQEEQPGMIVSPEVLKRHIQYMKNLGAVPIHLNDWIERKKNSAQDLPMFSVALTFDDGWKDNYDYAYPVLQEEQAPATIFLVTGMVDTQETFWPERILRLLCKQKIDLTHPKVAWLKPYVGDCPPKKQGREMSLEEADEVISRLKSLDDDTILRHLNSTESAKEFEPSEAQKRAILSTSELIEMGQADLVRYGAHTRHHFRLNRLESEEELRNQIAGCLEDFAGMPISRTSMFCYPNGDTSQDGQRLVSTYYSAACTTRTGWNKTDQSEYTLSRINLHDGNSHSKTTLLATIGRALFPIRRPS